MSDTSEIESKSDFASTPQGRAKRWQAEIAAAKENQRSFHEDGDKAVDEYLGKGGGSGRLNLWYADVETKAATLSGDPRIRAKRRHADAKDDVARVSADMLERLLMTDVERDSDGFRRALRNAKGDWLKPGLGQIRMRYVVEKDEKGLKTFEDVETDHVHWRDYLWSPARTYEEWRWEAYGADLGLDDLHKRFDKTYGAAKVNLLPLGTSTDAKKDGSGREHDPLKRCRVWEIWDKESKEVVWFVEGVEETLDVQPDPLGLPGFFPSPEPLAKTLTSSKWMPRSPYFLAEGLYEEAHELTRRIRALVKTIKVAGAYSKGNDALARILTDACENELVPVQDIASLMGEDGLKNPAWIMPIDPQVKAVVELIQQRNLVRADIAEVLGLSDIMRGQQAQRVTATTDRIKARAFSMRQQTDQDEYARFASDAQRIRGFIIAKLFDPKTIIERSNIEQAADPEIVAQAVQLLKSDIAAYRIDVDADSLTMTDFDAVQQDAISFMTATSEFFQRWAPLIQTGGPVIAKFAVELFQRFAAQIRGAERFEDIIDRMVSDLEAQASQPPEPPPPDPKLEATKIKAQAEAGKAQATMAQTQMDMQAKSAEHGMKMQQMQAQQQMDQANFGMRMAEVQAKRAAAADMPEIPMKEDSDG